MLRHRNIDRICCVILVLTLLVTCCFVGAGAAGLITADTSIGYENRLFDQGRVHTIEIVMDDWDAFIADATSETYYACTMVIDGEKYGNVAIRGKGNTSLSNVASYGNDRYSFKVEFDHYQSGSTYHGLDKLSLNNIIQDATYLKDYFAYTLMGKMNVAAPLCSFVQINVNGEPWGLYLAVEGVEDSFLTRNFGSDHGELYKPDSMSFGGGRGNGREFDMDEFTERFTQQSETTDETADSALQRTEGMPSFGDGQTMPEMPTGMNPFSGGQGGSESTGFPQAPGGMNPFAAAGDAAGAEGFGRMNSGGGNGMSMGSSDVMLQYIDDDPASYSNIFDNAKTDITDEDKARLIASLKTLSDTDTAAEAVDVEQVIRYFAVHNFLCNDDSYTGSMIHNYYLYEENGVLSMIPWDYNLAFGGFGMGGGFSMGGMSGATSTVNSPIDSPVSSGDISTRPMIAWIFADETYTAQYHEIYAQLIAECFDSGWFASEIDRVSAMIAPYVEKDTNGFYSYDEFQQAVATLREFCLLRAESVAGQLNGTIPSTTAAQNADSSALIDASHLTISDMGSMGGGMGGGDMQRNQGGFGGTARESRGGMTVPGQNSGGSAAAADESQTTDVPAEMQPSDSMQAPDGMQMPGGMQQPDGMQAPDGMQMPGGMQMPDGMSPEQTAESAATAEPDAAATAEADPAATPPQSEASGQAQSGRLSGFVSHSGGMNSVPSAIGSDAWLLLGASAAVLLIGLLIAWKFRSGR